MRRAHGIASILLPLLLAGCGQTVSSVLRLSAPIDRTLTFYHAYGDSITFGYALPHPESQAYPVLIAHLNGLPLTNYAIPGDQACDVSTRQIFSHADSPSLARRGLYTLLISTNDANFRGPGPYENVFNRCHQAAISWLALPVEDKILATSSLVTTTGPVHLETRNNWNAMTTDARGASISFPIQLATARPLYIWYRIMDGYPGTFAYAIDGKQMGSAISITIPAILTSNGSQNSMAMIRIPSVSSGTHTVTFTQTSDGTSAFGIVAIGAPPAVIQPELPIVLVGTTPRELAGGATPCGGNEAICLAYVEDIAANVAIFQGDGLKVRLFDTRKYMSGTAADLIDIVHPNATGHVEIAQAVEDVLD